jgi:hypothetical protein
MRLLIALFALATSALAQSPRGLPVAPPITPAELESDLRVLAADSLMGRAPGTAGGRATTAYIAKRLESMGVQPGANGSFLQQFEIVTRVADPATLRVTVSTPAGAALPVTLAPWREVALRPMIHRDTVAVDGEMVFAGFGIASPAQPWDDYKGADVRGKVVVVLGGEPYAPNDTTLFAGRRLTRFGTVAYKIEEAKSRGAAAVVLVLPQAHAAFRSPIVAGRWRVLAAEGDRPPFAAAIYLSDSAFVRLLAATGGTWDDLRATAASRDFRPKPLGVRLGVSAVTSASVVLTENVVGVIPGRDANLRAEHVALVAHWDGLGVGAPVSGDSIYNGAIDNASGVANVLAIAKSLTNVPPRRSIALVFTTAKEWGLLGADAFARAGPIHRSKIVAMLNFEDGSEYFGETRDVLPIGAEQSELGTWFVDLAGTRGLLVKPDPNAGDGAFESSETGPFARMGIPGLVIAPGSEAIGRASGWMQSRGNEYMRSRYRRPSDEVTADLDFASAAKFAMLVRDFALVIAIGPTSAQWGRLSD